MTKELLAIARTEANQLRAQQRWPELVRHWQDYAARLPKHAVPLFQLADALIKCNQFSEAEVVCARLRTDFAAHPSAWIGEAMLDEALKRWAKAEAGYRATLEQFPDHAAVLRRLPKVLVKQGKVNEAKQILRDLLVKYPGQSGLIRQLEKLNGVRKVDIINQLIQNFRLTDYFEYNKYLAELAIQEVTCERKQIAYIPENKFGDLQAKELTERADYLYASNRPDHVLDLDRVMKRFRPASFDIIFFDPMHTRPQVDLALQRLPLLLKPDGLMVIHDCNPHDAKLTAKFRNPGSWCGQTYQAFANFHENNPYQSMTIDTDLGVGVILNRGLRLNYPLTTGPDYEQFAERREAFIGLIDVETFQTRLAIGQRQALMTG